MSCAFKSALAAALLACASCAGGLEDVDRFAPPFPDGGDMSGDAGSMDDGGDDGGLDDAGISDAGAGDAGTLDAGPSDAGPVDAGCNALATIIAPSCATALCHSSGTQQGSLDLQSPGLPQRLFRVAAVGGPGMLIDPQHPDASVLYTKTLKPPPYGQQMPLLGKALSTEQLACLRSWIHQAVGAP